MKYSKPSTQLQAQALLYRVKVLKVYYIGSEA